MLLGRISKEMRWVAVLGIQTELVLSITRILLLIRHITKGNLLPVKAGEVLIMLRIPTLKTRQQL
jgi:hypothetical protein